MPAAGRLSLMPNYSRTEATTETLQQQILGKIKRRGHKKGVPGGGEKASWSQRLRVKSPHPHLHRPCNQHRKKEGKREGGRECIPSPPSSPPARPPAPRAVREARRHRRQFSPCPFYRHKILSATGCRVDSRGSQRGGRCRPTLDQPY